MFAFLLIFVVGTTGIILSILSWRLKSKLLFGLTFIPLGITLLFELAFWKYIYSLIIGNGNQILGFVLLSFIVIPVIFLIQSKVKSPSESESEVTDRYLDEILNAEDEKINFE